MDYVYNSRLEDNFYIPENSKNKLLDLIIGDPNKEENYLDLGANSIALSRYITKHKKNFHYTGIDIEPNWYVPDLTREDFFGININNISRRCSYFTMDINEYLDNFNKLAIFAPIDIVKFDCIIMSSVLHEALRNPREWREYTKIIKKALNVLKEGGRIIIRDGVIGDYFLDNNDYIFNNKLSCEFKDMEKAHFLMMQYIAIKKYNFLDISSTICFSSSGKNYYSRAFLKNFLSAYSWYPDTCYQISDGFKRESQQDHFNLYTGDWVSIKNLLYREFNDDINIELNFYPDEYKKYINKLVEWNDGLEKLWEYNSAIMIIIKEKK